MITEAFMSMLAGLFNTLISWLQALLPSPPAFWSTATSAITTAVAYVPGAVMYFLPVGPVIAAAGVLLALIIPLGLARLTRRLVSLFTGGGGA